MIKSRVDVDIEIQDFEQWKRCEFHHAMLMSFYLQRLLKLLKN